MKKFFCNNRIAKLILAKNYSTITIGFIVLSKYKKLSFKTKIHESIHIQQWCEITFVTALLAILLASNGLLPLWCTLLSVLAFYALYGLEWLIRCTIILLKGKSIYTSNKYDTITHIAYRNISFEREAKSNELNDYYLIDRYYFKWISYIADKSRK